MREFNTKVAEGHYSIDFETDDIEAYERVESLCRLLIDRQDNKVTIPIDRLPVEWLQALTKITYTSTACPCCIKKNVK